jgi:hypothetical protein
VCRKCWLANDNKKFRKLALVISLRCEIRDKLHMYVGQGCQMVYFQTKNLSLGKFWRALNWKQLVYCMVIWSIFRPFGIFYGTLVYFVVIWYIFSVLVYCTTKNLATLMYGVLMVENKTNRIRRRIYGNFSTLCKV